MDFFRGISLHTAVCALLAGGAIGFAMDDGLFSNAVEGTYIDDADTALARVKRNIEQARWVDRFRITGIDLSKIRQKEIVLNLFDDVIVTATETRTEQGEGGSRTFVGKTPEGQTGSVLITYYGETVVGNATVKGILYRFWTLSDRRCVIVKAKSTGEPKEI